MIVVRTVMHARFGRGGDLAAEMAQTTKSMMAELGTDRRWRVLTDLGGPFDTVVLEVEAESLSEWDQVRPRIFTSRSFRESMPRTQELVMSGRGETWNVEASG
jgi:hypothetical protein